MEVEIFGQLKNQDFHMAKLAVETLCREHPEAIKPEVHALTDTDWAEFLEKRKKELQGEVWGFKANVIAFVDGNLIGDGDQFLVWAKEKFGMVDFRPPPFYEALANQSYAEYLSNPDKEIVYLDIAHDKKPLGRMIFELFKSLAPATVENFVSFLTSRLEHKTFKDSVLHRVIKNGWVQGGDFITSSGAQSVAFNGDTFPDESFAVDHSRRGTIGMANDGPHTNGSQFYITFTPAQWMNKKYVAFGYIIEGMKVLDEIEQVETYNERPKRPLSIHGCGRLIDLVEQ